MENNKLWDECGKFHGHKCPGLTIGYRAALYAKKLLELDFSHDENIVCISENDACCVDSIQLILGCSAGKGNLLFHMRGKMAFSFYNRKNGKSIRLLLNKKPKNMTREELMAYFLEIEDEKMFQKMPVKIELPEEARLFESHPCAACNEMTGANWIRIKDGEKYCLDCYKPYDRFNV